MEQFSKFLGTSTVVSFALATFLFFLAPQDIILGTGVLIVAVLIGVAFYLNVVTSSSTKIVIRRSMIYFAMVAFAFSIVFFFAPVAYGNDLRFEYFGWVLASIGAISARLSLKRRQGTQSNKND